MNPMISMRHGRVIQIHPVASGYWMVLFEDGSIFSVLVHLDAGELSFSEWKLVEF